MKDFLLDMVVGIPVCAGVLSLLVAAFIWPPVFGLLVFLGFAWLIGTAIRM